MLTSYQLNSVTCFAALLIGQPTLRTRLRLGVLAALDQRIALRAHMLPGAEDSDEGGAGLADVGVR